MMTYVTTTSSVSSMSLSSSTSDLGVLTFVTGEMAIPHTSTGKSRALSETRFFNPDKKQIKYIDQNVKPAFLSEKI